MDINCPDLKVGAIEKQAFTRLLPQASLRGAHNQRVFELTSSLKEIFMIFRKVCQTHVFSK